LGAFFAPSPIIFFKKCRGRAKNRKAPLRVFNSNFGGTGGTKKPRKKKPLNPRLAFLNAPFARWPTNSFSRGLQKPWGFPRETRYDPKLKKNREGQLGITLPAKTFN